MASVYSLAGTVFGIYVAWQIVKYLIEVFFPQNLRGKAVVCIGSTTGFGNHFVLRCAQEGMTVFAGCNSPNGVQKVREQCAGLPGIVHPFQIDLACKDSIQRAYDFVGERLPPGAGVHCLMNNAGIIKAGVDDWLTVEDYEMVFRVNTLGLMRVTKLFKEHVKLARGRIVFCSSVCGRLAFPFYGPYTMSKFAMEGYVDTIRRELAPFGVHVAIVEPGYFRTPLTDPSHIPGTMVHAYQQAPAHIKEQYGEEFINKIVSIAQDHLASGANSPRADWVTDVYFHAATAIFPCKRYVVGLDANLVVVPISRLPAEIQDLLFALVGILQGIPTPKVLKSGKNMMRSAVLQKSGEAPILLANQNQKANGNIINGPLASVEPITVNYAALNGNEKGAQFPSPLVQRKLIGAK